MSRYHSKPWYVMLAKALAITVLTLLVTAMIFCLVVLIYGGCTNQSFLEVLQAWFAPKPVQPTDGEKMLVSTAMLVRRLI